MCGKGSRISAPSKRMVCAEGLEPSKVISVNGVSGDAQAMVREIKALPLQQPSEPFCASVGGSGLCILHCIFDNTEAPQQKNALIKRYRKIGLGAIVVLLILHKGWDSMEWIIFSWAKACQVHARLSGFLLPASSCPALVASQPISTKRPHLASKKLHRNQGQEFAAAALPEGRRERANRWAPK